MCFANIQYFILHYNMIVFKGVFDKLLYPRLAGTVLTLTLLSTHIYPQKIIYLNTASVNKM